MITDVEAGVIIVTTETTADTTAAPAPTRHKGIHAGKRHAWHEGLTLKSTLSYDVTFTNNQLERLRTTPEPNP